MNPVLQRRLIALFHYALHAEGHLVLGQAESVGPHIGLFTLVDKRSRIYRKKSGYDVARRDVPPREHSVTAPLPGPAAGQPADPERGLNVEVSRLILDRYSPAGVLVDPELQIIQVRGQTGAFLEPAPGDASLSLLKMLREGLLYGVRSAFQAARKSRRPARREGLRVRSGHGWRAVNVEVMPLSESSRQHYLVLFEDARPPVSPRQPARKSKGGKKASARTSPSRDQLQRELDAGREYMQIDHRGAGSRQRGAPVGQRGDPVRATRSCRAPTRSSTPRRRSCSRRTKSSTRSTRSCRRATTS